MTELRLALKKWYIALPFYSLFLFLYLFCTILAGGALRLLFPGIPMPLAALPFALLFAVPPVALRFSTISSSAVGRVVRRRLHTFSSSILTSYLYLLLCIFVSGMVGLFAVLVGWCSPTAQTYRAFSLVCIALFLLIHLVGLCSAEILRVRHLFCHLGNKKGEKNEFLSSKHEKNSNSATNSAKTLRIAFISDLHFGAFTEMRFFRRLFRRIPEEKPDILLIGGDLFDFSFDDLAPAKQEKLKKKFQALLPSLPLGIYACEGNHDRVSAAGDPRIEEFIRDCGIRMLRDDCVSLDGLLLVGRKDFSDDGRKSASALLAPLPKDRPVILLDHRPKEIRQLSAAGADLVLCGHVHNGQSFPGNLLYKILSRYPYGKAITGDCLSYTTSGCGRWGIPMRFLTADELVLIDVFIER